jgi:hypothetical protein
MKNKKLLIVTETIATTTNLNTKELIKLGSELIHSELKLLIEFCVKNFEEVCLVNPFTSELKPDGCFNAYSVSNNKYCLRNIIDFNVVYFSVTLEKVVGIGLKEDTLFKRYGIFLNSLKPFVQNLFCINKIETLIATVSKQYILDSIKAGKDYFIPTKEVRTIEELFHYNEGQDFNTWVIKPKIPERSFKIEIISNERKSISELTKLYGNYFLEADDQFIENDRSTSIKYLQGLIVQEYQWGFLQRGERKVTVIDGEIVSSYKTEVPDVYVEPVIADFVGKFNKYSLGYMEKDFVKMVYSDFTSNYPAHALRIDFIEDEGGNLLVNEIESLNQTRSSKLKQIFASSESNNIFKSLFLTS